MTTKTKSTRFEAGGHSMDYIEHLTIRSHVCRVTVHTDGYAAQSYGRIERWNGEEWKMVAALRGSALAVDLHISYKQEFLAADDTFKARFYAADRRRLVTLALEVLGG